MTPQSPPDLDLTARAEPAQVGAFRRALRRWLDGSLDAASVVDPAAREELADLADDLVLATSEALENVVDHAYASTTAAGGTGSGPMSLRAHVRDGAVAVVVTDRGHWRDAPAGPRSRGRGLEMMERLAESRVDRGDPGTVVTLRRRLPSSVHDRPGAQA